MSESKYIGANVATQTDTFASWIERTNQMVFDMSTVVITTFANSTGGQTTGNAHVNGLFSANTLIAKDIIRGGTVNSSGLLTVGSNTIFAANSTLNINSNTIVGNTALFNKKVTTTDNTVFGGANTTITSNVTINNTNTNITGAQISSTSNVSLTGANIHIVSTAVDITSNTLISGDLTIDSGNLVTTSNVSMTSSNVEITGGELGISSNVTITNANVSISSSDDTSISATKISLTSANVAISGGELNVTSNASLSGDLSVGGNLDITGVSTLSSNVSIGEKLAVTGAVTLSNTANIAGATTITNTLAVSGNTNISDQLTVTNNTALNSALSVSGVTTISSNTITRQVAPSATNTYNIGATTKAYANGFINYITTRQIAANGVNISGGNIGASGSLNANGGISVAANTTANAFQVDTSTGNIDTIGNLEVDGTANIGSNVTIHGSNTVITGHLRVEEDMEVVGNIIFTSNTSATDFTITNDTAIGANNDSVLTINARVNTNIIPTDTDTYDLGSTAKRWKNVHSQSINSSNATIENISVTADLAVAGNTVLGDNSGDVIDTKGSFANNVVPTSNTLSLGSTTKRWTVYANTVHLSGNGSTHIVDTDADSTTPINVRVANTSIGNSGLVISSNNTHSYQVWHENNDGATSGLDADLLDGQEGSYYRNASNISSGTLVAARLATSGVSAGTYGSASAVPQFTVDNKGRITSVSDVSVAGVDSLTWQNSNNTLEVGLSSGATLKETIDTFDSVTNFNANLVLSTSARIVDSTGAKLEILFANGDVAWPQ
tara:strand:+ start:18846 stop:21203 length:2358 start_codon:yes stop_codon:yes gene_type:complete